jgi:hypothetical protein
MVGERDGCNDITLLNSIEVSFYRFALAKPMGIISDFLFIEFWETPVIASLHVMRGACLSARIVVCVRDDEVLSSRGYRSMGRMAQDQTF